MQVTFREKGRHPVSTAGILFGRFGRSRRASGRLLIGDDLLQAFDAIFGEGRDAVFADTVDVQAAVFGEHVDRELGELAASANAGQSGRLTLAAITAVFTINHVAKLLGEDEDWLHELSIDTFPEDGCLHVYGIGEDGVTAFTEYGIECLKQIIADEKAAGSAPTSVKTTE